MTASTNKLLFSWDDVEYLPDLQRLEFVLRYLPDEDLLRALNGSGAGGATTTRWRRCGGRWWQAWCSSIPPLRP